MFDIERSLRKIVSNFWFEWNADVHMLFRTISPYVWGLFRRNLYRFLRLQDENPVLYRRRLAQLFADSDFLALFRKVEESYQSYMNPTETIVSKRFPDLKGRTIAYFSMEYGIDTLRIYSGGLGILSGDHLRGASDVGLQMVGVGLFYLQGYYEQVIGPDGNMRVIYEPVVPPRKAVRDFLPLEVVKKAGTLDDLIVQVPMGGGRIVRARVWRAKVGRSELLLLDSDLRENRVHDRHITRRLYASQKQREEERRRRLEQELLLGIGGVQALIGAGYQPAAYHLNEGHVAFAALEVIRMMMQRGLSFDEARRKAAAIIGFTTHTPVPEGNERFEEGLVRHNLNAYLDAFLNNSERDVIYNCARNREDMFDMTKLSLLLSGAYRNGVSALHGEVCRRMWGYAWGNHDPEGHGVEIGSITNSVHVPYWQKPLLRKIIEEHGGLEKAEQIPDEKIWDFHQECKVKLIAKVRERVAGQMVRDVSVAQMIHDQMQSVLDPAAFIIGFARRFAEYKRVTLILDDEERLFQFLENAYRRYNRPVHILYGGKPHPDNQSGRDRIRYIREVSERLERRCRDRYFKAQILFIEGYDIDVARYLETGVDVWLNNPIRPLEASGTSGMKAGMNGVLNVSISDGWVPEGVEHRRNGWLFGRGDGASEAADRNELFALLENEILPLYFLRERDGDVFSRPWLAMMKSSIRTITEKFNTDRMLTEYIEKMYVPAVKSWLSQDSNASTPPSIHA